MKITDGVFAYPWTNMMENNCNTYVLQGSKLVLVDPGLRRYVPNILEAMQDDGLNPDDINLILCTHSHPDHIDGIAHFEGDKDVQVTMNADEEKFLNQIGKEFFRMFGLDQPQFDVAFYCNDGDLNVNGIDLKILQCPGHSPGSVCVHWPEKKVMISGDVVFQGSVGRTDFPGGSGSQLKESIEKISKIPADYLLPGHNDAIAGAEAIKQNYDFIKRSFFSFL